MSLQPTNDDNLPAIYDAALTDVADILDAARRASARSVNSIMTAAYWLVGRRIVEYEQGGEARAEYGSELIRRLSVDLTERYGRGFSPRNLRQMRAFYLDWQIRQTVSAEFVSPRNGGCDDSVGTKYVANSPDAVWRICTYRCHAIKRRSALPPAVVSLRTADFGTERSGPRVLRN